MFEKKDGITGRILYTNVLNKKRLLKIELDDEFNCLEDTVDSQEPIDDEYEDLEFSSMECYCN